MYCKLLHLNFETNTFETLYLHLLITSKCLLITSKINVYSLQANEQNLMIHTTIFNKLMKIYIKLKITFNIHNNNNTDYKENIDWIIK